MGYNVDSGSPLGGCLIIFGLLAILGGIVICADAHSPIVPRIIMGILGLIIGIVLFNKGRDY